MTCEPIPVQLTEEQKGQTCAVVSVGCDWQTAANIIGCSLVDFRRAMRHDAAFAARIRRAGAGCELSHMRNIHQAGQDSKNWRASVWWLERHSPERYGRRGAGVVTARQIKTFVDMLADILREDVKSADERKLVIGRLTSLTDMVDEMLCDGPMNDANSSDVAAVESDDRAEDRSFGSHREEGVDFEETS
jgi:hypothetical protein